MYTLGGRSSDARAVCHTGGGLGVSSGDVIQVILDPDDPVATVTVA